MRTVDKLDKIGAEKVRALLIDDCGVDAATARTRSSRFIAIPGTNAEVLAVARAVPRPERDV